MDYDEEESSEDLEPENYYKLTSLPPKYPVSYAPRKPETKNDASIGLPLRKSIMVGSSYQATVPELIKRPPYSDKKKPYSGEDKLLWNPNKLADAEVERYLATVQRLNLERARGISAIPRGAHTRDDEQALYTLAQCGYSVEKALQKARSAAQQTQAKDAPMAGVAVPWSEEECKNFESGIRIYGKEFFLIRANKVSIGVRYYETRKVHGQNCDIILLIKNQPPFLLHPKFPLRRYECNKNGNRFIVK